MDALDSRLLHYGDCFAQQFPSTGDLSYWVSRTGASTPRPDRELASIKVVAPQAGEEHRQHDVTVQLDGDQLGVDHTSKLRIAAGDVVVWHAADASVGYFAVSGHGSNFAFDSRALTAGSLYTHAFAEVGSYAWSDPGHGHLRGRITVRAPEASNDDPIGQWFAQLCEAAIVSVRARSADPPELEIVQGQAVAWIIEEGHGISITEAGPTLEVN